MLLYYFIFGFLFALIAQPVLENLTNLFCTFLELIRNKLIDKMTKEENTHAIGFCLPEEEEYNE